MSNRYHNEQVVPDREPIKKSENRKGKIMIGNANFKDISGREPLKRKNVSDENMFKEV